MTLDEMLWREPTETPVKPTRWDIAAPDVALWPLASLAPLRATCERVLDRWPDAGPPPDADREALVQKMMHRLDSGDWSNTPMSLVIDAAHAVFDEERRDRGDLLALRQFYAAEILVSTVTTFLNGLMAVYIATFDAKAPHTAILGRSLMAAEERFGGRWRKLIETVPDVFQPSAVSSSIARMMIAMPSPWNDLRGIGLRSPHAPGLMNFVHSDFVALVQPTLDTRPSLDKLLGWLRPEGQPVRATGAASAIEAILGHWLKAEPEAGMKQHITQSLIALYGDPRTQRGGAWASVGEACMMIFLRWVTGENIRFFMDVVSHVNNSPMWEPRRRFWLGLHEKKRIDAAWVAFSKSGAQHAERLLSAQGKTKGIRYGRQVCPGTRSETSLLILKCGNKTIVEGSHSYRIHIFRDGEAAAPSLYAETYDCDQIMRKSDLRANRLSKNDYSKTHMCACSSLNYPSRCPTPYGCSWQNWVLERI